jgi:ubiquinone/menaquinone biosynthesis C-methylase UbiE
MDTQKAVALYDAMARTGHPRNDYRTEEAKRYTHWMLDFATNYISPNDLLVDLGCGAGKQTFQAEELGARAVGLDCAFEALNLAKTIADEMNSLADFIRGNYVFTPFASDSIDVVLFHKNLVECSYAEAELLAAEIDRILKPGGRLILTLPDSMMKYTAQNEHLSDYDPLTGLFTVKVEIPDQGEFDYLTYFWTCGYAVHLFSQFLDPVKITPFDSYCYLLVLEKREGPRNKSVIKTKGAR